MKKNTVHVTHTIYQIQLTRRIFGGDVIGNVAFRAGITNDWEDNISHTETRYYNVIQQVAPLHSVHGFYFTRHHYKHNVQEVYRRQYIIMSFNRWRHFTRLTALISLDTIINTAFNK